MARSFSDFEIQFYNPDIPADFSIDDHRCLNSGPVIWTCLPHHHLVQRGIRARIVTTLPTEGILVAHTRWLPRDLRPSEKLFTICMQADHAQNPWSPVDIVQNPTAEGRHGGKRCVYVPHFPQLNLIPRPKERGNRFERIAFFGTRWNIDPALRSPAFEAWLKSEGLVLDYCDDAARWNDYRQVDAVLAIRSFDRSNLHREKPATKLYNAWLAGVPAIVGAESACRAHRQSDLDFLEVQSLDEVKAALLRLKNDPELRRAMRENGLRRGLEYTSERTGDRWAELFRGPVAAEAERWFGSPAARSLFLAQRQVLNLPAATWRNVIAPAGRPVRNALRSLVRRGAGAAATENTTAQAG